MSKIQGAPMSGLLSAIRDELEQKEFRESYVSENVRRGLAYQIRALREAKGWSQAEFARRADRPQSNIYRWEDPTYGKFTLSTLIEIASVFDVALSVRFVGFEELLTSVSDLRPSKLAPPSYQVEQEKVATERVVVSGASALEAFYRSQESAVPGHDKLHSTFASQQSMAEGTSGAAWKVAGVLNEQGVGAMQ